MSDHCAECGAPRVDGEDCWAMLGHLLAWEAHDAELAREHFLTVASYNLQHPAQFTDEAIAGLRTAYVDYLDRGISIAEIRRRATAAVDGARRVLRDEAERRPVLRPWTMTVADVHAGGQSAGAAQRVRQSGSLADGPRAPAPPRPRTFPTTEL
jgi:hypothetical protein